MAELNTIASAIAALQEDLVMLGGIFALAGIGLYILHQQGYFENVAKKARKQGIF